MKPETAYIDWDSLPDLLPKEMFYRLAHVSKRTARELLLNGTVPCINNGKKTHCYLIRKEDARAYIDGTRIHEQRQPVSGYICKRECADIPEMTGPLPEETKNCLRAYYTLLLSKYPDVITAAEMHALTGYNIHTIYNWCRKGRLKNFLCQNAHRIPKVFLIDFLCGVYCRGIAKKTEWHKMTLQSFIESQQQ